MTQISTGTSSLDAMILRPMIHENVQLCLQPGQNEAFEFALVQVTPLFQQADGALSFRLEKRSENPQEYVLAGG